MENRVTTGTMVALAFSAALAFAAPQRSQPPKETSTATVTGCVHPRIVDMITDGAASVTPSAMARPTRNKKLASDRVRASNRCSRYS